MEPPIPGLETDQFKCSSSIIFMFFFGARSYNFRTAQEAGQIYRAGMTFLQQHLALTRICARLGPVAFLDWNW